MERMERALIKLDRFTISRKAKLELSAINSDLSMGTIGALLPNPLGIGRRSQLDAREGEVIPYFNCCCHRQNRKSTIYCVGADLSMESSEPILNAHFVF
jgi:hypothetical protein